MNNYLAIAACIRTNFKYSTLQWFLWNKFIGVDHFYLIDNNSEVPLEEIFEDFSDDVTIIKQPEKVQQMDMYNDLYVKYKSNCTWMAFLDDDEFLFNYASKSFNIKDFLKKYEHEAGIELQWNFFAANSIRKELVFKNVMILDAFRAYYPESSVKSIVNCINGPEKFTGDIHRVLRDIESKTYLESTPVNCFGDKVSPNSWHDRHPELLERQPVSIHHYSLSSLERVQYKLLNRGFIGGELREETKEDQILYRCNKIVKLLWKFSSSHQALISGNMKIFDFGRYQEVRDEFFEIFKKYILDK